MRMRVSSSRLRLLQCRHLSSLEREGLFFLGDLRIALDRYASRLPTVSARLQETLSREEELELRTEETRLSAVARSLESLDSIHQQIEDCEQLEKESEEPEMREMAMAEKANLLEQLWDTEYTIVEAVISPDENEDAKEAVLEIRAGTGGSEAQLFAMELLEMYRKYCGLSGWKFDPSITEGDLAGTCREASVIVKGKGVYAGLRFEGGVHRVQRKPLTDKTRIHTSTATIAVLPMVKSIDSSIPESDLIVETTRARGAGGQHVNTTDSAIKMTHIPTGLTVSMQDDRSQHRNRAQALVIITAKVLDMKRKERDALRSDLRRSMIGSGERSERIRTYNFPQDRITDHRINHSEMGIDNMMAGQMLDTFSEKLIHAYNCERLDHLLSEKQ